MCMYLRLHPQAKSAAVQLSGPTSFAAVIRQAIEVVRSTNEYHILLIVADGQVDQVEDTANAIVEASEYPLSIVAIGVGDGPWDLMETFDDELAQRKFDNCIKIFRRCVLALMNMQESVSKPLVGRPRCWWKKTNS